MFYNAKWRFCPVFGCKRFVAVPSGPSLVTLPMARPGAWCFQSEVVGFLLFLFVDLGGGLQAKLMLSITFIDISSDAGVL